jgi:hypothetical protein
MHPVKTAQYVNPAKCTQVEKLTVKGTKSIRYVKNDPARLAEYWKRMM